MVKSLEDYYKEFIEDRSDEICNFICRSHDKYQELSQDTMNRINELLAKLPGGQKDLLYEYEEKKNEKIALMIELIYDQGVKDGIFIINKYNKIRRGK